MDSNSESLMSLASSISRAWRRRRAGSDSAPAASVPLYAGRCAADLHAAGFRAQFLEFAHPALLAPHLIVLLADPIHGLRLILVQALETPHPIHLGADIQIGAALRDQGQVGGDDPGADARFLQILPANVGRIVAAEAGAA